MCDNLSEYFISNEDEPQSKNRKTIRNPKQKLIRKSNFSQVRKINIYEKDYKKWISKNNLKISDYFKKVSYKLKITF